jgi:hypothetical protein
MRTGLTTICRSILLAAMVTVPHGMSAGRQPAGLEKGDNETDTVSPGVVTADLDLQIVQANLGRVCSAPSP